MRMKVSAVLMLLLVLCLSGCSASTDSDAAPGLPPVQAPTYDFPDISGTQPEAAPAYEDEATYEDALPQQQLEPLVFVVGQGEKYHKESCRYIRNAKSAVKSGTIGEALNNGYEACKVCRLGR